MRISKLISAINLMRNEMSESMQVNHVAVFLCVIHAHNNQEQLEVLDVGKRCRLSSASTSRNLAALGDWHWRQKPGLGLLTLNPILSDRRRKLVTLTPRGKILAERLEGL